MGLLRLNDNFFIFRKAPKCLCWEREIGVRRDFTFQQRVIADKSSFNDASVREEGTFCFWSMRRIGGEKKHLLGGPCQLSETETSKRGNMSEVLRRNPSNKTSEIRRTFVFRTSTPARAAVTSENKHSICDIFSEYFLLKVLHNLYIIPKLFIKLCWVACYIADSFNKSQMWQIIHRCLNACF